jgi:hypothetical protein
MAAKDSKALKSSALVVAIVFALCVVCSATGYFFFGSSKIRPLFGMSAEALAGYPDGGY